MHAQTFCNPICWISTPLPIGASAIIESVNMTMLWSILTRQYVSIRILQVFTLNGALPTTAGAITRRLSWILAKQFAAILALLLHTLAEPWLMRPLLAVSWRWLT